MKFRFIALIISFSLTLILGCKEENDLITNSNNSIPSDSVIVPFSPIDSKVSIGIYEVINPSNRNAVLFFSTEKIYPSGGYEILIDVTKDSNTFKIKLKEIQIPECGIAVPSPASIYFNLSTLQEGSYFLDFTINTKKIAGLITVTKESFDVKIQPNNILYFNKNSLCRIPETIIWGQVESILETPSQLFLDSLIVLGAKPHNLKPGNYYYFTIKPDGDLNISSIKGMTHGKPFLYNYEGDNLITRSLVKRFAKKYQDSIYIHLSGGKGEEYYSTVLKNES